MQGIPLSKSKHLLPYAALLRAHGVSVSHLLRKANLPSHCLDDPESLIPAIDESMFRELAAQQTGYPNISLEACQALEVEHLGDFGQALLSEPTVAALLHKFCKIAGSESSNVSFELYPQPGGGLWFNVRFLSDHTTGEWHNSLYVLNWMLKFVQLADSAWSPTEILVSSKASLTRFEAIEILGSTARLEQNRTGFVVPASILALPVGRNSAQVRIKNADLWSTAPATTYVGSLKQVIRSYADDTWLNIDQVSEVTDNSVRTLQRRLATEQETWSSLVQQCRAEMAADLLENTDATIAEIADRLGYRNQTNFSRAFYRWAKVSPREFRKHRSPANKNSH
jgi:AraC-like DNA-binding protein